MAVAFNYGSHWIKHKNLSETAGDPRNRIYNRRNIHPKRYSEADKDIEVAVLGCDRRDNKPDPHSQQSGLQYHKRHKAKRHVDLHIGGRNGIIDHKTYEHEHLDHIIYKVVNTFGNGRYKPREIHLSENPGITQKRRRALVKAV